MAVARALLAQGHHLSFLLAAVPRQALGAALGHEESQASSSGQASRLRRRASWPRAHARREVEVCAFQPWQISKY